ncbi:MAG: hypothetical protein KAS39_06320, partial [Actinomycetia bacterium]|nr:hypothetical protein [Actinomycetes bacterium]
NILKVLYNTGIGGLKVRSVISEINFSYFGDEEYYTLIADRNGMKILLGERFTIGKLREFQAAFGYFENNSINVEYLNLIYKNATYKEL